MNTVETRVRQALATAATSRAGRLLDRFLPRGALTLSILAFGGYAAGLVRDKMLAHTFGAGADLDTYNAAFVLPELALDVLVAGGLVAPFVPMFLGLRNEAAEDARRFGRTVLTLSGLVMGLASAVLFVLAPQTIAIVAPGFGPDQRELYVGLFRVMCLTPVLFALSIVVGEVLVAERRFLFYGLGPMFYSGGIVVGTVLLSGPLGIYGAAVGAVGGAAGHLAVRMIGLRGTGFRPLPSLALQTRGLGEFLRLMAPKMVSQPLEPLTFLYFTGLASSMAVGSVSSLNYARNFAGAPVSLIGMSIAVAAFPALSLAAATGDREAFGRAFGRSLRSIVLLSGLAALGLFLLSHVVIGVFLGGGAFDATDVDRTSLLLAVLALSVPIESVMHLLARAIYATRNTLLPTLAAMAGFVVVVVASQALAPVIGLAAIPASYTAGMGTRVVILLLALAVRQRGVGPSREAGIAAGAPPAPARLRRARMERAAILLVIVAVVGAGTVYAATRTFGDVSIAAAPVVTPWAQVLPLASHEVPSLPPSIVPVSTPGATAIAGATATPSASAGGSPSASPSPTPAAGPFAMDLYEKGDFVGELKDTWCVPAAMQTSINIMSDGADTSRALQTRLWNLAYALAPGKAGGADPDGWAAGLAQLGYGNYVVDVRTSLSAAVKTVVSAIRLTNRPAGLIVWYGYHSWVVSGFKATADPALGNDFKVTGLYIEDVWYNRLSTIWGYSNPPDTFVPLADLPIDYKAYQEWTNNKARDGKYVFVMPTP